MKRFRFRSYRSRILALCVIVLAINFALTTVVVGINLSQYNKTEANRNVEATLQTYAGTLGRFFQEYENSLKFVADNPGVKRVSADPSEYEPSVETLFRQFQDSHKDIRLMSYGTELGQYFFDEGSNEVPAGYDPRIRPWYLLGKSLSSDEVGFSDIYKDINNEKNNITMVKQIYDENGRFAGVLGVILDLEYLTRMNQGNRIGQTGYTFVTRDNLNFINNNSDLVNTEISQPEILAVSAAKESQAFEVREDGDVLLVQSLYLPAYDLTIWSVAYQSELLAPLWSAFQNTVIITISGLAAVLTLVFLISKYMVKEMNDLAKVSLEMAGGNLEARAKTQTSDELQVFADNFNVMADTIEKQTKDLINSLLQLKKSYRETVLMLSNAIEANDHYTKGHCIRVEYYAVLLGKACGMPIDRIKNLEYASLLHDIGKIGVPTNLLNKEDGLTDEEYVLVKKHPLTGYFILHEFEHLKKVADIVRQHQEFYNGKGYPFGLSGEQILLEARIISIADTFDAMTTSRPYRKIPLTWDIAVEHLNELSGSQFDPNLINKFCEIISKIDSATVQEAAIRQSRQEE